VVANAQAELAHALGREWLTLAAFYVGGSSEHVQEGRGMGGALDCGKTEAVLCPSERSKLGLRKLAYGEWRLASTNTEGEE
jgi:hypothetical protein